VATPSAVERYTMLGWNAAVPPFVRQALFSRTVDNDDVLATLRVPLLITHGAADAVVRQAVVDQTRRLVPHAEVDIVAGAGHAPFHDAAAAFDRRLAAFCDEVARAGARTD
jgi:pimeloyl-ACP methyl ester carboxylesterase